MSSRVWIMLAAAIAAMILLLLISPTAFPAEVCIEGDVITNGARVQET